MASGGKIISSANTEAAVTARNTGSGETGMRTCSECGGSYPACETTAYGNLAICESCKDEFFRKVREGRRASRAMIYGGFWIRFGAKILDYVIAGTTILGIEYVIEYTNQADNYARSSYFLELIIPAAYSTFFIGKFAATPGKMAARLVVVSPDGGRIGYVRALGRHLAEYLSGLIFSLGYIMAAFSDEKRTLHDLICSTRVIKKTKKEEAFQ